MKLAHWQRYNRLGAIWLTVGLVGLPLATVLSRLQAPSNDIWAHLSATVLPIYLYNSAVLVLGTTIASVVIGV
ncbi:MAG: iron ABC transporter permease, partial [Pseudomonadota bacterium]